MLFIKKTDSGTWRVGEQDRCSFYVLISKAVHCPALNRVWWSQLYDEELWKKEPSPAPFAMQITLLVFLLKCGI